MSISVENCHIEGLLVITPRVFDDERGFFMESYNKRDFQEATGLSDDFVQDNHSLSKRGVLRGLHFQVPPHDQGKLVRVIKGEIFDVAVDIRNSSATLGKYYSIQLSAENKRQLWIPTGFAHGFFTLSKTAEVIYKTTDFYSPKHEKCILWDDSDLNIAWPEPKNARISTKDLEGISFRSIGRLF